MPTLDLNPEIVCEIIIRAKEFQAQEEVVIPEDSAEEYSEEDPMQILADHQNDLTFEELKIAINDLEPDQRVSLIALMLLGRGDYTLDEWDDALAEATEVLPEDTAEFLLTKPYIANFLEAGLDAFGYKCDD